ncbi:MAG TPA: Lrp/AsnC family transcriptional regulator [Longimicrobiaceae bacterium]|nr:Lrp/AsnC family transcriptional regulator [Longimicrobiaceae bacterium]
MANLDKIDIRLLSLLQADGRISQHELSRAVGLSAPAVSDRLRKLEERGVIRGYSAVLEAKALDLDVTAFIVVGMNGSRSYPEFRKRVADRAEVLESHAVTGEGSHLLKVRTWNSSSLEQLLADIQSWPGVQWTTTSIVLSTLKETSGVSLDALDPKSSEAEEHRHGDMLRVPFRHQPSI